MGTPSTSTRSDSTSTRRPSAATSPFTVTRPAAISCSAVRRLPIPTRASTFCRRSPVGSSSSGGRGLIALPFGAQVERVGRDAQPLLERLDHLGARHELAQRRQIVERRDAQLLEEQLGGAEQHRLSGTGIARYLFD